MLSRFKNSSGMGGGGDGNGSDDEPQREATTQNSLLDLLDDGPVGLASSAGPTGGWPLEQGDVVPFPQTANASSRGQFIDSPLLAQLDAADAAVERERAQAERQRQRALREEIERDRQERMAQRQAAPAQSNRAPASDPRLVQLDLLSQELEALKAARQAQPAPVPSAPPASAIANPATSHTVHETPQKTPQQVQQHTYTETNDREDLDRYQVEDNPLSFGRFVRALLRGWWVITICAIAGAVLSALYALSLPNQFQSVAEVLIEPRGLKVLDNSVAPTGLNSEATVAFAESQVRIITSSSVLDPVIRELELDQDPEFNGTAQTGGALMKFMSLLVGSEPDPARQMANARETLDKSIFVSRINQTFTIQIGVTTEDPSKSARIANAIAAAYLKDEAGAKSSAAQSATEDLSGRLDELRTKVRDGEERVERYKAENGLVDADGKLVSDVQLARLNDQLALAQIQTTDAQTKAAQARRAGLEDVLTGSVPSSLSSNAVNQLRVAYSRAKSRRDRVATRLGELHPERKAAESELRSARGAIESEIQRIIRSAQSDFERAKARQSELVSQVNSLKGRAVNEAAAKVELRELQREVDANRRVFESILLRSRETDEQSNIRSESARIITEAQPPRKKSGPARKLVVAAGTIGGGAVGAALALIPFVLGGLKSLMGPADGPTGQGGGGRSIGRTNRDHAQDNGADDLYATDERPAMRGQAAQSEGKLKVNTLEEKPASDVPVSPAPAAQPAVATTPQPEASPAPRVAPRPAPYAPQQAAPQPAAPYRPQPVQPFAPQAAPVYPVAPQPVHYPANPHAGSYSSMPAQPVYPTPGYPPVAPAQQPPVQGGFFDPMTGQPLQHYSALPYGYPPVPRQG
ncbi:MAG: Wzz/FepE/Etk N-terminal domain-containing protein [Pseudomonadota bacterium]